jgi:D-sedoheptulose 7-phosphate isomerase
MKRELRLHSQNCTATTTSIFNARDYFEIQKSAIARLSFEDIDKISEELWHAYEDRRKVFLFGNGGSASLACHFACDLGKGTALPEAGHKRFQVLALTNNVALLTAIANDISYEHVFAEQLRNLIDPGDIAFAISGSGNSPNVLRALEVSRELGGINIGLGGFSGGRMKALCDYAAIVASDNMQVIEDLQMSMAHALFSCLRQRIMNETSARAQAAEAS